MPSVREQEERASGRTHLNGQYLEEIGVVPASLAAGMDYWTAANILVDYMESGVHFTEAPPIPFFENVFPGIGDDNGLTATQQAYRVFRRYAPDYATSQWVLDVFWPSKFGPYAMFDNQYSALSARRDSRRIPGYRLLGPLYALEDQSHAQGLRCHPCIWGTGITPAQM